MSNLKTFVLGEIYNNHDYNNRDYFIKRGGLWELHYQK